MIEIGPGPGGLTRSILALNPKHLYVIELDLQCLDILKELKETYVNQLTIIADNALNVKESTLGNIPRIIISNLPYNISTLLLLKWLKGINKFHQMTLMFQKEVVDRIIAQPSTKSYGRLSVISQWLCKPKFEFHVNRRAFVPEPKVNSSLVTLTPYPKPLYPAEFKFMEMVTAKAFGQRRKMLRSSLKSLNINLLPLGIDPKARAENLTLEEYCLLAESLKELHYND